MKDQAPISRISPRDLERAEGVWRLDVRTPGEFAEKHLPGSDLHPLHDLDAGQIAERAQGRAVCVICHSGARAAKAAARLGEAGLAVTVLQGGVAAWEQAGLPLNRGEGGLSLERQVRIAAGILVLLGVLGSLLLHPAAIVLSGFVGAGLIFAGITDWCGMGLLLARMPWNRGGPACCHSGR